MGGLKADSVTQLCNSSTRANQKSQRSDSVLPGPLCGFRDEFKVPKWAHYSPRVRSRECSNSPSWIVAGFSPRHSTND